MCLVADDLVAGGLIAGTRLSDAQWIALLWLSWIPLLLAVWPKVPATVPPIFALMYLQAHQLDTEFYDHHFAPGAYLRTQAEHDRNWA